MLADWNGMLYGYFHCLMSRKKCLINLNPANFYTDKFVKIHFSIFKQSTFNNLEYNVM